MRNYMLKCIAFLLILGIVNLSVPVLSCVEVLEPIIASATCSKEFDGTQWTSVTSNALRILNGNPAATSAIIGDSVMGHFFGPLRDCNPEYCIAEGNSAFLMLGQYILLQDFLNSHPDAKKVFLIVRPLSLGECLNGRYSYQFIVLPFMNAKYREYIDQSSIQRMNQLFTPIALQAWFQAAFHRSRFVQKMYLNMVEEPNYVAQNTLSNESELYLNKMFDLCEKRGVQLVVLACPMADTVDNRQAELNLRKALENCGLIEKMPYYFDSLLYYPESLFYDGIHFEEPELYEQEVIQHYQDVTNNALDIVLG